MGEYRESNVPKEGPLSDLPFLPFFLELLKWWPQGKVQEIPVPKEGLHPSHFGGVEYSDNNTFARFFYKAKVSL